MHCVIIGGGVAGFQAALACRASWPDKTVTLVDAEGETGYYRTLLPQFMVGALPEERLFFPRQADDPRFVVRTGARVRSLDRAAGRLMLETGDELSYDRLVLAHGGDPYLPGILAGPAGRGIFPVRDLTTARAARQWLDGHRRVVVCGGSLVGVKTALHLRTAGCEVTLVARRGHILLRALSPEAAGLVETHLENLGIRLHLNAPLEDIRMQAGAIAALKAGGEWLPADTLLAATGIVPDTSFLEGTGLLTAGELLVSPTLQTADPRIFAAGDVAVIAAEGGQRSPNTWPQAVSQGRRAGSNLYRTVPLPHRDLTGINAMELQGLPMVILGPPVAGAEVVSFTEPERLVRRELFLVAGRPVGGALIGDISAAGPLHARIAAGGALGAGEAALLRPRTHSILRFPARTGPGQSLIPLSKRSRV